MPLLATRHHVSKTLHLAELSHRTNWGKNPRIKTPILAVPADLGLIQRVRICKSACKCAQLFLLKEKNNKSQLPALNGKSDSKPKPKIIHFYTCKCFSRNMWNVTYNDGWNHVSSESNADLWYFSYKNNFSLFRLSVFWYKWCFITKNHFSVLETRTSNIKLSHSVM